ncbi:MAG: hypothetical protein L0H84_12255 [Pseudonocardia sp.]|nr:hypothetical protein [Pseudonocardia sp.]
MTDRYADAVRARRAELHAERAALAGSHRGELRSELALSRLATAELTRTALRQLAIQVRARIGRADRADRARVPGDVAIAVAAIAEAVDVELTIELAAALRRIAGSRALDLPDGWPPLPDARPPVVDVAFAGPRTALLAGTMEGITVWRTALVPIAALPLLGLPVLSLPVLGGPTLAPLAIGLAVAGLVVAVRHRRGLAERAALQRATEDALATARAGLDADTGRRLLELERAAGADLDMAVQRRRAAVEAQLRELAPAVADA